MEPSIQSIEPTEPTEPTEPAAAPSEERWLGALFLTLALLYVVPFWIVHYLPTVDGPCHTYNAWILRQHGDVQHYPLFQKYYEINAAPYPNWIGHGVMALLMFAVPPLVAEKLLASAYALTLLTGVWYLAGTVRPGGRWLAFLAFPFVFNFMFQFGFYNFSVSLALFPWVLGFWWRHRERPGSLRYGVGINLLLWLCYFSHILSFALALLAIAVLWLATLRREDWRRHLLHIPVLAPQILLPIWYFSKEGGDTLASDWPFRRVLRYFIHLGALDPFGGRQERLARGLASVFIVLFVLTLWRHRRELRPAMAGRAPVPAPRRRVHAALLPQPGRDVGRDDAQEPALPLPLPDPDPLAGAPASARGRAGSASPALALVALLNLGYVARGTGR